ncbi:homing endonuclease associated repeat-containing protein [Haloprofundus marisrubri]|uniref:homing endonuclease associated repeat-containing protein n=1 Tax=Haloprofundus marisrubri TaxID=1514971 RepID=UPI0009E48D4F|nr:helix-hairpin-helix domain-containing protein [Haloprofundus marisrubri]
MKQQLIKYSCLVLAAFAVVGTAIELLPITIGGFGMVFGLLGAAAISVHSGNTTESSSTSTRELERTVTVERTVPKSTSTEYQYTSSNSENTEEELDSEINEGENPQEATSTNLEDSADLGVLETVNLTTEESLNSSGYQKIDDLRSISRDEIASVPGIAAPLAVLIHNEASGLFENDSKELEDLQVRFEALQDEIPKAELSTKNNPLSAHPALQEAIRLHSEITRQLEQTSSDVPEVDTASQEIGNDIERIQNDLKTSRRVQTAFINEIEQTNDLLTEGKSKLSDGQLNAAGVKLNAARDAVTEANSITNEHPARVLQTYSTLSFSSPSLIDVPGIGSKRETKLKKAGVSSLEELITTPQATLLDIEDIPAGTLEIIYKNAKDALTTPLDGLSNEISGQKARCEKQQDILERADSIIDTARTKITTARCLSQQQQYSESIETLETAESLLTDLLNSTRFLSEDQTNTIRSLRNTIETEQVQQSRDEVNEAVSSKLESSREHVKSGDDAFERGDYELAAKLYEQGTSTIESATSLTADISEPNKTELQESPEELSSRHSRIDERKERAELWQLMEEVEALVESANSEYADGSFESAIDEFRSALGICRGAIESFDLSDVWEVKQRESQIENCLFEVQESLDQEIQSYQSEAAGHLDRATELLNQIQQHREVDDLVAAYEAYQRVADLLDSVESLLDDDEVQTDELKERLHTVTQKLSRVETQLKSEGRSSGISDEVSKRDLLDYIQELTTTFGEPPRAEFINVYGDYELSTFKRSFGSWNGALKTANVGQVDKQARLRRTYSRVNILDAIVELTDDLGHVPSLTEMNAKGRMSTTTAATRFGDWETALQFAGVTNQDSSRERGSDTQLSRFDLVMGLIELSEGLERVPTPADIDVAEFTQGDLESEFGSWEQALAAAGVSI